jgi:hypothetical protein
MPQLRSAAAFYLFALDNYQWLTDPLAALDVATPRFPAFEIYNLRRLGSQ